MTNYSAPSLPTLAEGWKWEVTKYPDPADEGRPKVRVVLRDRQAVDRGHGTIDVQLYGDTRAVAELARSIVARVIAQQNAYLVGGDA